MKHKSHKTSEKSHSNIIGRVDANELARSIRRPMPPAGQTHRRATDYRRRPKHQARGWD
jgi:hypothetical protein